MPDGRGFSWDVVPVSAWDADATDDELLGLNPSPQIRRRRALAPELRLQIVSSPVGWPVTRAGPRPDAGARPVVTERPRRPGAFPRDPKPDAGAKPDAVAAAPKPASPTYRNSWLVPGSPTRGFAGEPPRSSSSPALSSSSPRHWTDDDVERVRCMLYPSLAGLAMAAQIDDAIDRRSSNEAPVVTADGRSPRGAMPAVIANGQSPRRAPDTLELTDELRGARQQARGVSAQLTEARKAAANLMASLDATPAGGAGAGAAGSRAGGRTGGGGPAVGNPRRYFHDAVHEAEGAPSTARAALEHITTPRTPAPAPPPPRPPSPPKSISDRVTALLGDGAGLAAQPASPTLVAAALAERVAATIAVDRANGFLGDLVEPKPTPVARGSGGVVAPAASAAPPRRPTPRPSSAGAQSSPRPLALTRRANSPRRWSGRDRASTARESGLATAKAVAAVAASQQRHVPLADGPAAIAAAARAEAVIAAARAARAPARSTTRSCAPPSAAPTAASSSGGGRRRRRRGRRARRGSASSSSAKARRAPSRPPPAGARPPPPTATPA